MDSRRSFLRKAALVAGTAGIANIVPASIQRAMAIEADPGTTFHDAEHVVFLMQENRSFDHMFGKLKGVRGFNDPHPHLQPSQHKVWLQRDENGHTFAPFHVDIHKTRITWQGGLPHSWSDQVAARNKGKYDRWVPVKSPMCMAHYDRSDIPFYYALADAFTVCDHSFCSSLTGTTPNRLYFWTGTIRPEQNGSSPAAVDNAQAESHSNTFVDWESFPELLEAHGVDWKVYQNELWTPKQQDHRIGDWVDNYGDNPLEYVKRYQVRLSAYFRKYGDKSDPKHPLSPAQVTEKYNRLSQNERDLIDKAFVTNMEMPADHLELETFSFENDLGEQETVNIPKNDIFHQFRSDVSQDKLPAVSWLVAPQKFSDHTSSPWYGAWYVSEALDILTKNPEIWKKTVFVLTYDENDGYFDHFPPFVVPDPNDPDSGKVSAGIDCAVEWEPGKGSPLGLGYRVPMVIASPWSKGGYVNSQVFDHTSSLMFLENFLSKKTGKKIKSSQISNWRRTVCGDLTSVFRPATGPGQDKPASVTRTQVVTAIQNARHKPPREVPEPLTADQIAAVNRYLPYRAEADEIMPAQEPGTRKACALPYHLSADLRLLPGKRELELQLDTGETGFGHQVPPAGAPFTLCSLVPYEGVSGKCWNFAVSAGSKLNYTLNLDKFPEGRYDLQLRGPNGFFRHFKGSAADPQLTVNCACESTGWLKNKPSGNIFLVLANQGHLPLRVNLSAKVYRHQVPDQLVLQPGERKTLPVKLGGSDGWYELRVRTGAHFEHLFAGHAESGSASTSDPQMGGLL